MDQGIGVDEFQRTGQGKSVSDPPAHSLCRSQGQDGPEALPAWKKAVVHGFVQLGGELILAGNPEFQGSIDQALATLEVLPEMQINPLLLR